MEAFVEVSDPDEYWRNVKTNLAAGKLRLVFVSDAIPPELRKIVEFLNTQMTETEVLAIEVKQFVDADDDRLRFYRAERWGSNHDNDWISDTLVRRVRKALGSS